jgi:hypothetical protein
MIVVELILTVTCPCDVVRVKVLPLTDATVPFAPGRWNWEDCVVSVDGEVTIVLGVVDGGIVDVPDEDDLEHATNVNDKAVANAKPITNKVIFLILVFMFYSLLETIMKYSSHFAFTYLIAIENYTTPK